MEVFIEEAPEKTAKCCGNCNNFSLWGVHTGDCSVLKRNKLDGEGKYCKSFDKKNRQ